MKHNLFLVHGMGVHETESWVDEIKEKLQETAERYAYFQDKDLEDYIHYLPVSYDQKLADLLELWKDNASEMDTFLEDQDIDTNLSIDTILGWFEDADEKQKNFFWSHIADVLIYRFFLTYQASIRAHVALQFVQKINWIKEHNPDNQSSTVITHSLGNIVAHDALHMLGSNMFDEHHAFEPADWKFQRVIALANVSRIMATDFGPYESIIRPESAGEPAYCHEFINVHHEYDPFTVPFCFSPSQWGNAYMKISLDHFHHWNIHSFDHYLDHPRIHIPLLQSIISMQCITPQEMEAAYDDYANSNQFGGKLTCIGEIKNIINNELKPLVQSIDPSLNLQQLVPKLVETYSIYEQLKSTVEACDE